MRGFAIVAFAGLLAACDETRVVSEGGGFELRFAGLHSEAWAPWAPPYRVVPGTRLCPVVACAACEAEERCAAVEVRASGPLHAEDGCFVVDAPGVSEWRVGAPCDEGDRATIVGVGAGEVVAEALPWTDRAVTLAELPIVGEAFAPTLPEPRRVIAGSQVRLDVRLSTREDGHVVAWTDGEVRVATTQGRAPVVVPGDALELVMFEDSRTWASFAVGGATWPIGQVVGVAQRRARSLALSVMLAPGEGGATPAIARAVVRDEQGRALLGLPVTWSLPEGALALAVDLSLPGPDWVAIEDACLPPEARGGPRSAVLRAEAGDLSAQLELRWDGVAGAPDPSWQPAEHCEEDGCGCRSSGPGWLGLIVVVGLRRRRRR